ncbi:putative sugar transporter [Lindgomyces ingoldianus]|uniref:Sugar transporter n=1 Tax=Lindgomyces ingoldianus TaxID=673940 RepID=A0ACB6QBE4_9PLEO|nr:putative sugar transporter [Lindgomyces ingoldianus]KAF2464244.1 putative sugar transporter [Lindgomyces ingoldianus]
MLTNVYLVASLATLGGLIHGFDVTSMAGILGTPQYKHYFNNPGSVKQGGITASMAGGSLIGSIISTFISDRFGRRDTLFVAAITWIVGSTLMCAVQNVGMLIGARVVNGMAVGLITSQGPTYIAEVAPTHRRGRLICLQQWMITWGELIMYFIQYGCSFLDTNASFRIPWGLQMIPAWALLFAVPFMPRSPRWLASKDRWEEAHDVLAILHAKGDRLDPLIIAELREIREQVELEATYGSTSWSELIKNRNIVRVHLCIFAHVWSQFSGINALLYYIVYIFQMAGLTSKATLTAAIVQYVLLVVGTFPALIFADRWSRRKVMMAGSIILAFWHFTQGSLMAAYGHYIPGGLNGVKTIAWKVDSPLASKAIIASTYLFVFFYSTTWGPMGWIYPPEIVPLYIRSKSVSFATACNWAGNFALTFFTPPGFQHIQWRMYMIFGTLMLVALIHVFFLFQETRGRTLEEMDEIFNNESIWAFRVKYQSRLGRDIEEAKADLDSGKAAVIAVELGQEPTR